MEVHLFVPLSPNRRNQLVLQRRLVKMVFRGHSPCLFVPYFGGDKGMHYVAEGNSQGGWPAEGEWWS